MGRKRRRCSNLQKTGELTTPDHTKTTNGQRFNAELFQIQHKKRRKTVLSLFKDLTAISIEYDWVVDVKTIDDENSKQKTENSKIHQFTDNVDAKFCGKLFHFIATPESTLKSLDLYQISLLSSDEWRILSSGISNLKELKIKKCEIGDNGTVALFSAAPTPSKLKELILESNQIGSEGAKAIANALSASNSLTRLSISSNNIGDEGCNAICESLKRNKIIKELDLECNDISDNGAKSIAELLLNNSNLSKLKLGFNDFQDSGCKSLVEALKQNEMLTELSLERNIIGCEGSKYFGEFLSKNVKNSQLIKLDLSFCQIPDQGWNSLRIGLKCNSSLQILNHTYTFSKKPNQ